LACKSAWRYAANLTAGKLHVVDGESAEDVVDELDDAAVVHVEQIDDLVVCVIVERRHQHREVGHLTALQPRN